jgi:hypothetical protein
LAGEIGSEVAAGAIAGAAAGAAGSIAGQLTAQAEGLQSGFDWGQVAEGAIGGAIGGGVSAELGSVSSLSSSTGDGLNIWGNAIAGASSYVGNDLAAKITGEQAHFSWAGLVASTVSSIAAGSIGPTRSQNDAGIADGEYFSALGARAVGDVVNREVSVALGDNHVPSWTQVGEDIAGFAIGQPIGEAIKAPIVAAIEQYRMQQLESRTLAYVTKEIAKVNADIYAKIGAELSSIPAYDPDGSAAQANASTQVSGLPDAEPINDIDLSSGHIGKLATVTPHYGNFAGSTDSYFIPREEGGADQLAFNVETFKTTDEPPVKVENLPLSDLSSHPSQPGLDDLLVGVSNFVHGAARNSKDILDNADSRGEAAVGATLYAINSVTSNVVDGFVGIGRVFTNSQVRDQFITGVGNLVTTDPAVTASNAWDKWENMTDEEREIQGASFLVTLGAPGKAATTIDTVSDASTVEKAVAATDQAATDAANIAEHSQAGADAEAAATSAESSSAAEQRVQASTYEPESVAVDRGTGTEAQGASLDEGGVESPIDHRQSAVGDGGANVVGDVADDAALPRRGSAEDVTPRDPVAEPEAAPRAESEQIANREVPPGSLEEPAVAGKTGSVEPRLEVPERDVAISEGAERVGPNREVISGGGVEEPQVVPNSTVRQLSGSPGIVTGGNSRVLGRNLLESMGVDGASRWPGYQAQHIVPSQLADHPILQRVGIDLDDASNGIFLRVPDEGISPMARHQGFHSIYNQVVKGQLDLMDVTLPVEQLEPKVFQLQQNLRALQQSGLPLYKGQGATVDMWNRWLLKLGD